MSPAEQLDEEANDITILSACGNRLQRHPSVLHLSWRYMSPPRQVESSSGHLAHVGMSWKPGHDDIAVTTASHAATRLRIKIIDRIVPYRGCVALRVDMRTLL